MYNTIVKKLLVIFLASVVLGISLFSLVSNTYASIEIKPNDSVWIKVCHKPGTPAEKTKIIPLHALQGHLGHGDYLGKCKPVETPEPSSTPEPTESPTASPSATPVSTATPTPEATQSPSPSPTERPTPAPKGPPEWEDPCYYLQGHEECLDKDEVFPGEGETFGPQK